MLAAALLHLAPARATGPNTPSELASDAWLNSRAVQATLSSGAVAVRTIVNGKSSRGSVEAAIRIRASARAIWPLITQCQYAAWIIPGLKLCRVLEAAPDGSWADVEHIVRYSVFAPAMHSVFRADYHPPTRMDFHRIGGNLKHEVGSWSLLPSAGDTTTVVYQVSLQPGFWIPEFVAQRTLDKQLPAALLSLRKHAEESAATE
ncbi:MAG TPA: SRPBCC family protein [Steroidobacteraceae bacterium]|nr:SRPBCC family protein [Steroidobacteraceae bacterium]